MVSLCKKCLQGRSHGKKESPGDEQWHRPFLSWGPLQDAGFAISGAPAVMLSLGLSR